eukprot:IDg9648t1
MTAGVIPGTEQAKSADEGFLLYRLRLLKVDAVKLYIFVVPGSLENKLETGTLCHITQKGFKNYERKTAGLRSLQDTCVCLLSKKPGGFVLINGVGTRQKRNLEEFDKVEGA